jgi:NADH-quinone oxidoreductase subunit J
VLVYAGAVMVLFLFVIMLLDLKAEQRRKLNKFALVTGVMGVGALGFVIVSTILRSGAAARLAPPPFPVEGSTRDLGRMLFDHYLLPFEVVSLLLLVAMVGVVLLSKKDLR